MEAINKNLINCDLFLDYDIQDYLDDTLPEGFSYCFFQAGDEKEWARIETSAKEFEDETLALQGFNRSLQKDYDSLSTMTFFIENKDHRKVATATAYYFEDGGKVHWIAIEKDYQGYHLSKPLLRHTLNIMKDKGYTHTILHTQTYNWLATLIYLNMGFKPIRVEEKYIGWQVIKKLTNHPSLECIEDIDQIYNS